LLALSAFVKILINVFSSTLLEFLFLNCPLESQDRTDILFSSVDANATASCPFISYQFGTKALYVIIYISHLDCAPASEDWVPYFTLRDVYIDL